MFNQLSVANISEKNTSVFMGDGTPPLMCHGNHLPLGVSWKSPSTLLKGENFELKPSEIILITLAKIFSYLKE